MEGVHLSDLFGGELDHLAPAPGFGDYLGEVGRGEVDVLEPEENDEEVDGE